MVTAGNDKLSKTNCQQRFPSRNSTGGSLIDATLRKLSDLRITTLSASFRSSRRPGEFLRLFALSVTTGLEILGAVIPRRVFTQPGP